MTRDWLSIDTAPKDGTRIRLGHNAVPGFATKDPHGIGAVSGVWQDGQWQLSSYFIIPGGRYGLMIKVPTHWMPLPGKDAA